LGPDGGGRGGGAPSQNPGFASCNREKGIPTHDHYILRPNTGLVTGKTNILDITKESNDFLATINSIQNLKLIDEMFGN